MRVRRRDERTSKKQVAAPVAAGLALLGALIATAVTAAAPIYTAWSAPVNLGTVVNGAGTEAGPALSGDGLSLYFFSGPIRGGLGLNDIYVSQRPTVDDPWQTPVSLGPKINTVYDEFVPAFSSDGHRMFFASSRPGGAGGVDIWQSYRDNIHDDFGWEEPTNLGPNVNSTTDDNAAGYFDNGGHPQLFFGSGRLGGAARDLFLSHLEADGKTWGPATLIEELSSSFTENRPSVRQDGLEIFFYSNRPGSAGNDLWTATRPRVDAAWSTPVNLPTLNSAGAEVHPYLSANAEELVFSSDRPGGLGSDLYMTTRAQIFPATKDECKNDGWKHFGIYKNQGDCVSYVATQSENAPG